MKRKGFTLLELIVVIIIIGILATLGVTQYTKVIEKGRTAEASSVLGTIRTAELAYKLEKGVWDTLDNVGLGGTDGLPTTASCTNGAGIEYYFYYSVDTAAGTAKATRCTGTAGKDPGGPSAYIVTINFNAGTITGGP